MCVCIHIHTHTHTYILRLYLFEREREHKQGRSRGRGRCRLPAEQGANVGLIPGIWDHNLSSNWPSHRSTPDFIFLKTFKPKVLLQESDHI